MTGHPGGSTPLQATVSVDVDRASVTLAGEIDRFTGQALADLLDTTMDRGVTHVELQMAQVSFVDIEGLRVLTRAHHLGAQHGIMLTLRQLTPHLLWLLQVTDTAALLGRSPEAPASYPDGVSR